MVKRYIVIGDDGTEIGIFHILDLLEEQDMTPGDNGDLEWAERKFNYDLKIPSYPKDTETEAWFTDKGVSVFEEALDILDILVGEYLSDFGYYFYELTHEPKNKIMYSDEYQVVYYK